MITWVLYDIKNNSARSYIAKACKHAGLYRVQYSCFLGTLNANEKDSLELQIEKVINVETDKVYLFRMIKEQLQECSMLGQAFDEKLSPMKYNPCFSNAKFLSIPDHRIFVLSALHLF